MKVVRGTVLALVGASLLVLLVALAYTLCARNPSELVERDALRKLGVLVSMDGTGQHVSSVNFSTLDNQLSPHEALSIVGKLREIKSLDLSGTEVTDADIAAINRLTSLASLSLVGAEIGDAGIQHITNFANLEALQLRGTNVSDACLPSIALLNSLKILDLSDTAVTGSLSPLASLPNLEWLVLSRLELQPGALTTLQQAPALKRVSLIDAKFAAEELEDIRARHPGIAIDE